VRKSYTNLLKYQSSGIYIIYIEDVLSKTESITTVALLIDPPSLYLIDRLLTYTKKVAFEYNNREREGVISDLLKVARIFFYVD